MSKTYIPQPIRRSVLQSHKEQCFVCGGPNTLDLHHIVPEYANGPTEPSNLVPLCTNKLGKDSCHTLIHHLYRTRECSSNSSTLTTLEYMALCVGLKALIQGGPPNL
jgi:hypothetical protein